MCTLRFSAQTALGLLATAAAAMAETTIQGERLDPSQFGPQIIEAWAAGVERDAAMRAAAESTLGPAAPRLGAWTIPAPRATERPHSGSLYAVNEHGALEMGVRFAQPADVLGAFLVGQGGEGVRATCIRAHGYLDGSHVATTPWTVDLSDRPQWVSLDLLGVDRVVFEAAPVLGGAAWFGLDDLTYAIAGDSDAEPIVIDFEDANFKQKLTGTDFAGVFWEEGSEGFVAPPMIVPAPVEHELPQSGEQPAEESDIGSSSRGGGGTPPTLQSSFQAVIRGDAGSFSAPPDTCGAIGPNHFVVTVNRNIAIYTRAGVELSNITLGAFLPGSNGDPRVHYDHHSDRWIVHVTDFDTRIYLAVSTTNDPTGSWFKTSFVASTGSDSGCFPDYPTLGVDQNGIYISAYMVGCGMSIFALDKAPLIAASPSLGTVTAFRGQPFEGAIQPVYTYGTPPGEYYISANGSSTLRLRRVNPPLTAPTLTDLGNVNVPSYSAPPDAPALGSATPLDTIDTRIMNAVYRDGSIYAAHCIGVNGRAAARWYQIQASPVALVQSGTVDDPSLYYFDPSIAVNVNGDLVMGFSGSNASQYAGAYYTGRSAADPVGEMAPVALLKAGQAPHNIIDGVGRNRWGDYSLTTIDPADDLAFWTIQEYVEATDIWGTWVAELSVTLPPLTILLPAGTPSLIAPGDSATFDVQILSGAQSVVPGSATLHYRTDGGAFQTTPLASLGGNQYQATLPAVFCDDVPEFYVSAQGDGGDTVTNPADAPAAVYSAEVGAVQIAIADNFETDQGWTVENVAITGGAWQRGVPVGGGDRGDPAEDADGSGSCYLTANVDGDSDVDGGPTRLLSPVIDMSATGEWRVSYSRWFTNDDQDVDRLDVHISNNAGASWTLVESVPGGAGWVPRTIDVADFVPPTAQMRVRFSATDNPNNSVTEAGIDAFEVSAFLCADPQTCPEDLDGDDAIGLGDLSLLLENFGVGSGAGPEDGDLDGDGDVDLADLSALLELFGLPCP